MTYGFNSEFGSYLSITSFSTSKRLTLAAYISPEDLGNGEYSDISKYNFNGTPTVCSDSPIIFWTDFLFTRVGIITQGINRWSYGETILGLSSGATFSLNGYDSFVDIPNSVVNNFIPGEQISGLTSDAGAYLGAITISWQSDLLIHIKYEIISI